MTTATRKIMLATLATGVVGLACSALLYVAGARINTTKSIPLGLYWTSSDPIEKGAYVLFCPPRVEVFEDAKRRGYIAAGFCPGDYSYMMKRVLAAKNDAVSVDDEGVTVNGQRIPNSKPLRADKGGNPLPRFQADHYALDDNELLLMGDVSARSFDGRYFGPVLKQQVREVLRPIFIW